MNVPKLRFKEFNDEWKKTNIKNVCNVVGGGTPDTNNLSYWNGNIQWFTPSEIGKTKYISKSERTITDLGFKNSSAKMLPKGAILLTSRATIGEASILLNEACTNQGFQSLIANKNIDNEFVFYSKELFKNEMYKKAFGSTFLEISKSNIEKIEISIPSLEEQNKISKFISLLDKKIELQSKKIEALKLYKMCILNKYFNENIKEKKDILKNYCTCLTGKSKTNMVDNNGIYYIMDMGTIDIDGNLLKNKPTFCNLDLLSYGDLIMPKDDIGGGLIIGKTGFVDENNKYVLGDHVYLIKTQNINSLYLHYQINSKYINRQLKRKVTGSAQLGLKSSNILNQEIFIYPENQQKKIATILKILDEKVKLENCKFRKLESLKKGLMQNMFV